jgi:cell division protein FtsA
MPAGSGQPATKSAKSALPLSILAQARPQSPILLLGCDVVPVGAQHITYDIAKTLQTPLAEAERIKNLYGTLVRAQSDEHESFSYPITGEDDGADYNATKARLADIIRPRAGQILNLVHERLVQNPTSRYAGDKVVLTGGASQLLGLSEFAATALGRQVRLGRPQQALGLSESLSGPQFTALTGLAAAVARSDREFHRQPGHGVAHQGYLGRVGSWLKAGF